jgi:hypothetical protein
MSEYINIDTGGPVSHFESLYNCAITYWHKDTFDYLCVSIAATHSHDLKTAMAYLKRKGYQVAMMPPSDNSLFFAVAKMAKEPTE